MPNTFKLCKKFLTTTGSFTFLLPASYDVIQVMLKWGASAGATDTLKVEAVEEWSGAGGEIFFEADGSPILGNSGQVIHLYDWKASAMKVTYTRVAAAGLDIYVKTYKISTGDTDLNTDYTVVAAASGKPAQALSGD